VQPEKSITLDSGHRIVEIPPDLVYSLEGFQRTLAFVHDPLVNWRLFNFNGVPQMSTLASAHVPPVVNSEDSSSYRELLQPQRGARERELLQLTYVSDFLYYRLHSLALKMSSMIKFPDDDSITCRAFAKALHYKETESEGALSNRRYANPVAVVEALIHINNQLHQHEAAVGILTYAQQRLGVQLKESWYR
uniref:Uncharacterized protein n=1 Tax=Solanum lycopersicum TaxID=4081 RepID=A0A3Q7ERZ7_SOLLC